MRLCAKRVGGSNFSELFFREVGLERFDKPPYTVVALMRTRQF